MVDINVKDVEKCLRMNIIKKSIWSIHVVWIKEIESFDACYVPGKLNSNTLAGKKQLPDSFTVLLYFNITSNLVNSNRNTLVFGFVKLY